MAITIKQLLNYSWMSQASYLDFTGLVRNDSDENLRSKLKTGTINDGNIFAAVQADTFTSPVNGFSFQDDMPNDNVGFSATMFKSNESEHYIFSVRGTEPNFILNSIDLVEDALGVVLAGKAADQVISGYRYYKQLTTAAGVQVSYTSAEIAELVGLWNRSVAYGSRLQPDFINLLQSDIADNKGLGIVPAGTVIDFTGHSLGGHVAALVANIAAQNSTGAVGEIVTYNAPGLYAIPNEILNWLGITTTQTALVPTLNIVGEGGLNVTAGLGSIYGPSQKVFIEANGAISIDNHSVVKLSDSLTLYDIFTKIVPALSEAQFSVHINKITNILKATSNQVNLSLENGLDSLRNLFKEANAPTPAATPLGDRNKYYENLSALQDRIAAYQGTLTIDSLIETSAAQIEGMASGSEALAYRYALKALNPFAITGDNSLYAIHNGNGELDLYDAETGSGTLTDQWLQDRANFLELKVGLNGNDRAFGLTEGADGIWYEDRVRVGDIDVKQNEYVLSSGLSAGTRGLKNPRLLESLLRKTDAQRYIFGSDGNDGSITGGGKADFLYGGGGVDGLKGLGGNDYLQGDAGEDKLSGGLGDDTLIGGKDADTLDGELGNDTYIWNKGDGFDTIRDARENGNGAKLGTIQFLDQSLAGEKTQVQPDNPHLFTDESGILYALNGTPGIDGVLTIVKPDEAGGLQIADFRSGDFGIVIPVPAVILLPPIDVLGTASNDNSNALDAEGNLLTMLESDVSDQRMLGFEGHDILLLENPGVRAFGGADRDLLVDIMEGSNRQSLYGEGGNDILAAFDGDDFLDGGKGDDALQGGAGDDELYGGVDRETANDGNGNDFIDGGAGSDVIRGGDGHDFILGGGNLTIRLEQDYDLAAEGMVDFLSYDSALQRPILPELVGVSPFSHDPLLLGRILDYELGFPAVEGDELDIIDGGTGNDWVFAGSGDDVVHGGLDDDYLVGQADHDWVFGDDGNDQIFGDGAQGDLVEAGGNFSVYVLPQFHGNDFLDGGAGDDYIAGDGGADELYGGAGSDTLIGDSSNVPEEFHGDDYLDGGDGNDTMYGYGKNDLLFGGLGDDWMEGDSSSVAFDKHGDDYLDGEEGNDHIQGDGGSDILFGGIGNDQLFGDADDTPLANQGDDYLDGEAGDDYLRGYAGNDVLVGGDGIDQLLGEQGDDALYGDAGNDLISGGDGDDELYGDLGNDDLQADAGDDYLDGGDGNDLLAGGSGADELLGGAGVDQLAGNDGDDTLDGGDEADTLFGDAGNDRLIGGAGADVLVGGAGDDVYVVNFADGDAIVDSEGMNTLQMAYSGDVSAISVGYAGASDLVLSGANGEQVLIQNGFANAISSFDFGGPSTLTLSDLLQQAQVGALTLTGGAADDYFIGGGSDDTLDGGAGADTLQGGAGNDTYIVDNAGDTVIESADEGFDTVRSAVSYTLNAWAEALTLTGAATIDATGNALDNTLTGNVAANILGGGAGDDYLDGSAGNDVLEGDGGADFLDGGLGDDLYQFNIGDGVDTIDDASGAISLHFAGGLTADDLSISAYVGDDGDDWLRIDYGAGDAVSIRHLQFERVGVIAFDNGSTITGASLVEAEGVITTPGTSGNDVLFGTPGNDILDGKQGEDEIHGGDGNDVLIGGFGIQRDVLYGDAGDDTLVSVFEGGDMYGGTGFDTYAVSGNASTHVFDDGGRIRLSPGFALSDINEAFEIDGVLYISSRDLDDISHFEIAINDYTANALRWSIEDASGSRMSMTQLLAGLKQPTPVGDVFEEYRQNVRSPYFRNQIFGSGGIGVVDPDGTLSMSRANNSSYTFNGQIFATNDCRTADFRLNYSVLQSDDAQISRIANDYVVSVVANTETTVVGASSAPPSGHSFSSQTLADGAKPVWVPISAASRAVAIGANARGVFRSRASASYADVQPDLMGYWVYPTINATTGGEAIFQNVPVTQSITVTNIQRDVDVTLTVEEIRAGSSDNEIHTFGHAIIDAGAGNDIVTVDGVSAYPVVSSNYALTVNGDGVVTVTLEGAPLGALLYGNDGNDTLTGGAGTDVLVGGSGSDLLDGRGAADQYRVLEEDGIDVIADTGDDVLNYAKWYYEGILEIPDWLRRFEHGGQYEFQNDGSNEYYDSLDDVIPGSGLTVAELLAQGNIVYVEPLPTLPEIAVDDFDSINNLIDEYIISSDRIVFDGGVSLDDLELGISGNYLSIRTGENQGVDVLLAQEGDPIGTGVEWIVVDEGWYLIGDLLNFASGATATAGDDVLWGTSGNDVIDSLSGYDWILGRGGDDVLLGGDDDDYILGGSGNDTLDGGNGNDDVEGGTGNDVYIFNPGAGSDFIWDDDSTAGNIDTVQFGVGITPDDTSVTYDSQLGLVFEFAGSADTLTIGSAIQGASGSVERFEFADGTVWNVDTIAGMTGYQPVQYLYGTSSDDSFTGSAGSDVYLILPNGGVDQISDAGGDDTLIFGSGITSSMVTLGLGSLLIRIGENGDAVHIEGFDPADVNGSGVIENFQFADGTELTYAQLVARGFDIRGTGGNDILTGTNTRDRVTGGTGDDELSGGVGSDTYYFNAGDGADTVIDSTEAGEINRVVLRDYLAANIAGTREGQYVVLRAPGTDDVIRILWDEATGAGVDFVEFANGATWDRNYLNQLGETTNSPPVVAAPIGAISTAEDAGLNFVIPANTFQDPDAGDVLTYTAALTSGGALPSWLSFDAETRTFSGTPLEADVGAISVQVTATDGANASVSDTFNLTVLNTNDAPVLAAALADQNAVEDQAFSFAMPAGAFADEDVGDQLIYTATLANGAALPEWLVFDDATNTFSGVPANGDTGTLNIRVTATDGDGVSASDTFTVTVAGMNDAPELSNPLLDQAVTAGTTFNYVVPVETFIDVDAGDSVTLSAQLAGGAALPAWLAFDAATGTFSGTFSGIPSASNVGVLDVEVVATDAAGAAANDQFVLTVNPAAGLTLTGTAAVDTLTGGYGNDVIDGLAGADQMIGGDGDDSYTVDNVNDAVLENPAQGHDTVLSSVTYTLASEVEDLILTGTVNRNGAGNDLANTITGNSGANRLDGGSGADVLIGGLGNDTYIIDNALDAVFEAPSAGTDTVQSSISITLAANVEHLTLTGEAAIDGTGNELANTITGNAAANTLIGGMGNDKLIGGAGVDTLIGGVGNDTYVIDLIDEFMVELAGEGTDTVQSPFDFTLAEHFENLTLTGEAVSGTGNAAANRLTGNALANVLSGLDGNDILDGKAGADILIGGIGNDIYVVDDSTDATVELAGEGTDTVQAVVSYTIGAGIERLTLTGSAETSGTGNALDNRLTGNAAVNTLSGLEGNDTLDGRAGADMLIGGAGNDAYIVDNSDDAIIELAGEGVDAVTSSATYALAANVENLTLSGAGTLDGTGNDLGNRLTGNAAANVLTGLDGNDILDGKAEADMLVGGAGDDSYIVDNVNDTVVEVAGEGIDTIQTTLAWTLGEHVENLTLTGAAAVNGAGNGADNVLTGNNAANMLAGFAGNDTLDGKAGADTLIGGAGDDTYVADNANDVITELAGEGTDTVRSSTSRTLGADLENLTLTGVANISGTGNALNNVIAGNTGNNTLDGGLGADVLAGGLGNDTYLLDDAGDAVTEAAGSGTDTVKTGMVYTLTANVENLTLTGTAAVAATGNELANVLIGNTAANTLTGLDGNDTLDGKAGADAMTGGAGDDVYTVDNAGDVVAELAGEGVDTVKSSLTYILGDNVENLALTGGASRNGTGNALNNILAGNNGANMLNGLAGDDALAGGLGNDTYRFDLNFGHDVIVENDATAGNLDKIVFGAGIASTDITLGRLNDDLVAHTADQQHSIQVLNWFTADANKVERIEFADGVTWDLATIGSTAMQVVDMPGLLRGSDQVSVLLGQVGNTVLEGAGGDDTLIDVDGNNLFAGGDGDDAATGGDGNDLFIGGSGNDTVTTGAGSNVIAFNAGGGTDTIYSDAGADNTLSLGGGLKYSDLSLSRDNNDLILNAGTGGDKVVLKDWYVGQSSLLNLQLILDASDEFDQTSADPLFNKRVQNFDFLGLVSAFDAAQASNPGLTQWALSDALMQYHLTGSDDAALGGDLAYWYARNNGLTGMSLAAAQGVIGAGGFGADAQSLHQFSGLQEGLVHLS